MLAELFGLGRPRNATIENPQVSLDDPETWNQLFGAVESASGVKVSHSSALTYSPVWKAVSMLSGDVATLPLYVYRRLPDDDREIDTRHPAYFLAAVKANEDKSARQFWRDLMVHALLWNNGYAYIARQGRAQNGRPLALYNLLPDRTAPERLKDGTLIYVTEVGGQLEPLMPWEVLHVRGVSLDGVKGCDLVQKARESWGLGLAAMNFASKFFKNGARMGGILELPSGMSKPARDNVEEGFRKSYEAGENPFRTVILREGAKFHGGQITPEQGQVIELREHQVREVADYFNIQPSRLGLKDSFSYNSNEQDNLSYLHGALRHWLDGIADESNMKLLTERELRTDSHYFEHNVSKMLQADVKTLNETLALQRQNEIISANEWRRKINLPRRLDPAGDEYVNPNTKSNRAQREAPAAEAHRKLLVSTLARMARRVGHDARTAAKSPQKFCAWLDGKASEHRAVFAEALQPVLDACCEVLGGCTASLLEQAEQGFFDPLLKELGELTEPPHASGQLQANVESRMDYFERTAGERVAALLFEETP